MIEEQRPQYFGRDLEAMSFANNYHEWIVGELAPYLGDDVAEVGAGIGNFSALLRPHVQTLTSFEPSANMYPELARRYADDVAVTTHNDFFGDRRDDYPERFDSVVYVNVMEHIEDDAGELAHVMHTLKPGGHVLIFVPALQFLYSELDRQVGHHRRYHKKPLAAMVSSAGFRVVSNRYFDSLGVIPWYLAFTLMKRQISGGNVSAYDRFAVPVVRAIEKVINPPFGKNLLLVAQKPA